MTPNLDTLGSMPVHESAEALRKRLDETAREIEEKSVASPKPDESLEADPRTKEAFSFDFRYVTPHGKSFEGRFKNRILTIAQNQRVGALQAEMALNKPYDSLDPMTREINLAVAHMMVSLDPESLPSWAKDLRALHSVDLLFKLYEEVVSHEATFHGLSEAPSRSAKDDRQR